MKKVLFFVVALASSVAFFSSCTKEDTTLSSIDLTDLTTALIAHPDLLDADSDLNASARGGGDDFAPKKMKKIDIDSLSDIIKTYIAANYADATITAAFEGKNGGTVVVLTLSDGKKIALLFDATGAFVKEVQRHKGHGKGKDLTKIDVAQLPSTVTSYVSSNYTGATIEKAATNGEGNYFVVVKKADGTIVGLAFDKDGNFLKVLEPKGKGHLTPLDIATLSNTITGYISTNYVGSTIEKAYTGKDANIMVTVKQADGTIVRLLFDSNGVFVKVLKKK